MGELNRESYTRVGAVNEWKSPAGAVGVDSADGTDGIGGADEAAPADGAAHTAVITAAMANASRRTGLAPGPCRPR